MRHRHSGDDVCIVYVTDGRRSRAMGLGSDAMVQRRHQEALTSAASLDVARVEWLGLREGDWQPGQLFARLASLTQRFAPHVIYVPSRVDFHPEHRAVAHALASFFVEQTLTALVRVYQVQVPLTSILTNLVTDVSGVKAESEAARRAYVTQADSVRRTRRLRRYAGATYRIGAQTESFWQMSLAQYCALHSADHLRRPDKKFRSIRHRSFSDPLAYLLGRFERRRLLNIVRHTASDAMHKAISDSGEL